MDNLEKFKKKIYQVLSKYQILEDRDDVLSYSVDRTKDFKPDGSLVLFPRNTLDVKKIVEIANEFKISLVPSGGRTGYSGGAVASNKEVVVSLEKMNKIIDFDPTLPSIVCEAGTITKNLQNEAKNKGFYFPVDFASSYSSHIGGNIATNAGGIHVIRYGSFRNWVLGLEVVTGKGDILNFTGSLIKNNTGYDLKQLFIGSEGTLGFITKATLLLTKLPEETVMYFIVFSSFDDVINCLEISKIKLPAILCFEVFDFNSLDLVCKKHNLAYPFPDIKNENNWYVLIEVELDNKNQELDIPYKEFIDAISNLGLKDLYFSKKESIKKSFFIYREYISEAVSLSGKFHKNDISLPIRSLSKFIIEIKEIIYKNYKDYQLFLFGHVGDGNIHINLLTSFEKNKEKFLEEMKNFDLELYHLIKKHKGSISAEHGIGLLKKPYLHFCKTKEEIEYMKSIKKIFDPNYILNPGKIFD